MRVTRDAAKADDHAGVLDPIVGIIEQCPHRADPRTDSMTDHLL
jgi:hypothetical protein